MEEALNNLREAINEFIKQAMQIFKECFEKIIKVLKEALNNIDYEKYIKYKKYQKRVKNRKILYAKRRAKYGR
ncbi:Uncharacterised protein [uncultured Clostridium sp.]|uniref:DUF4047 domain-containing protein n=1 Tax=uncultured Clostridium sp. TaxID=59620 RepID=UPI000821555E|nr:DUF4047 domain-containing protein [uncultured Clostridium sp.]SCJ09103.1 Uncharacterised protein [uncultured Clostridium sp.]